MRKKGDYYDLYEAGEVSYDHSRFADAAGFYHQAMNAPHITEELQVQAKYSYASSLFVAGIYEEAIAHFSELYVAYKDNKMYQQIANRSYQGIIHVSIYLHCIGRSTYSLQKLKTLINRGLAWLSDTDNQKWCHTLLLDLAEIYYYLGEFQRALDTAEEAYLQKKQYGGGYYQGTYIHTIARISRVMNELQRSEEVLSEANPSRNDPYTIMRVDMEHLLLLMEQQPLQKIQAFEIAQRTLRPTDYVQSPFAVMHALGACGVVFTACDSYLLAKKAFHHIQLLLNQKYPQFDTYFRTISSSFAERTLPYLLKEERMETKDQQELYQILSEIIQLCSIGGPISKQGG